MLDSGRAVLSLNEVFQMQHCKEQQGGQQIDSPLAKWRVCMA